MGSGGQHIIKIRPMQLKWFPQGPPIYSTPKSVIDKRGHIVLLVYQADPLRPYRVDGSASPEDSKPSATQAVGRGNHWQRVARIRSESEAASVEVQLSPNVQRSSEGQTIGLEAQLVALNGWYRLRGPDKCCP